VETRTSGSESGPEKRTVGNDSNALRSDFYVVVGHTQRQAERALAMLQAQLGELGLATKAAKTRIVHLHEGGEEVDFLGFALRLVRAKSPHHRDVVFLARRRSPDAMQHARDRIRFLTARARLAALSQHVIAEVNRFLRGWAGYYRYGKSAQHFDKIRAFAVRRLARYIGYRHERGFRYGWHQVAYLSSDNMDIISLIGIVVAPRPYRPWREKPKASL
jgi:RNA-directed DNA polymerase